MKRFLALLLAVALARGAEAGPKNEISQPAPLEIIATQPWLAVLTSVIGGENVTVREMKKGRQDAPHIIALEPGDAGVKPQPGLHYLYNPFPVRTSDIGLFLADPAVLPFVAQRVLAALSDWDPSNYPYYQRRLAEFQARLSGSVLAGQQILAGVKVFDLSGESGPLLRAARCQVVKPDLERGVRELLAGDGMIVIDAGTPKALQRSLAGRGNVFFFGRPAVGQDYPAFLHEQYLALWQKVTLKK